jgi:glycosyltransferase involved in cell wall biosynthesis
MKVLHIGKYYPPFSGGIETFMADLLPELDKLGVQQLALVHDHLKPSKLIPEIKPDQTYPFIYRAPCYGRLLYAPISPHFPFWFYKLLEQFKPDLLHFHVPNTSAFWFFLLANKYKIPYIVHWHADVVSSTIEKSLAIAYKVYRPFEQQLLKNSKAIIATSPTYLKASPALKNWEEKCRVIPLGLNPQRLPNPTQESLQWAKEKWGENTFKLLHIGRLTYYKGQSLLLQAVAQIKSVKLLLVGDGELKETLNQNKPENVELLGRCSDEQVAALLSTCETFCLPSIERTEAFGMVLLEAMNYSKPLIVNKMFDSGVSWVAGNASLKCEIGNIDDLKKAIIKLRDDPNLRNHLGQLGSQRLQHDFHISQIAQQIKQLYIDIL